MPAGPEPEYREELPGVAQDFWAGGDAYPADRTTGWYGPECGAPFDLGCSPLQGHLWFRGQYVLGWTKGSLLPPLVTTSPAGTAAGVAGVLGQPGTAVLFGDSVVNTDAHSGGSFTLGYWLDPCYFAGLEANYTLIGAETTRFSAASPQTPIIARPFFDTEAGAQAAMLVAHPSFLRGSIDVDAATQFQAVEVLLRRNLFQRPCDRIDFLVGWRYARLNESLRVQQSSEWTAQQGQIIQGTTKDVFDAFETNNEFQGGQLGVVYQEHIGRWSLEAVGKVALGNVHSQVVIDGGTRTEVPGGGAADFVGGLLAQETNMGTFERNDFAVIPEFGVTLGYDLTCRLRATFGYNFLYWNKVARPADQIDVNVSQLPPEPPTGALRPAFAFAGNDFWSQGLRFGLDFCF